MHRRIRKARGFLKTCEKCTLEPLEVRTLLSGGKITVTPPPVIEPVPDWYAIQFGSNPPVIAPPDDLSLAGDITIDATTSIPTLNLPLKPAISYLYTQFDPIHLQTTLYAGIVPAADQRVTSITYIANSLISIDSPPGIPYRIVSPDGIELLPFTTPPAPVAVGSIQILEDRLYVGRTDLTNGQIVVTRSSLISNMLLPAVGPGAYLFTLQYSGDSHYLPATFNKSASSTLPTTSIHLSASPSPKVEQVSALTATVSTENGIIPDMSVQLWERDPSSGIQTLIQTLPLSLGSATFTWLSQNDSPHTFVAEALPNEQFDGSVTALLFQPAPIHVTTSLTTTTPSIDGGSSLTLTASPIADDDESLDGQAVQLFAVDSSGSHVVQTATVTSGSAVFTFNAIPGDYQYYTKLADNPLFDSGQSNTLSVHVLPYAPVSNVVAPMHLTSYVDGGILNLDAQFDLTSVRPDLSPWGNIHFYLDDGTVLEDTFMSNGHAVIASTLTPGDYTVQVTYDGNEQFAPETDSLLVHAPAFSTHLEIFQPQILSLRYGQLFYFSPILTNDQKERLYFNNVQLRDPATGEIFNPIDTAYIQSLGIGYIIPPGSHDLEMTFLGSHLYLPSSATVHVEVSKGLPQVNLNTSTKSLDVSVGLSNTVTASGKVTLYDGAKRIASKNLKNGHASWSFGALRSGRHNFKIVYSGDSNFLEQTSTPLTLQLGRSAIQKQEIIVGPIPTTPLPPFPSVAGHFPPMRLF